MHIRSAIAAVFALFPDLSESAQLELEAAVFNVLAADRRNKLGELQGAFACASCQEYRKLADQIMLDNDDLKPRACLVYQ